MFPRRLRYGQMKYLLYLQLLRLILHDSAYCTFVYVVIPKWNYVMQIIESMGSLFQPLEKVIY